MVHLFVHDRNAKTWRHFTLTNILHVRYIPTKDSGYLREALLLNRMVESLLPWSSCIALTCPHKRTQAVYQYVDSNFLPLFSWAALYQVRNLATTKRETERALPYPTVISPSPGLQDYATPLATPPPHSQSSTETWRKHHHISSLFQTQTWLRPHQQDARFYSFGDYTVNYLTSLRYYIT